MMLDTWFRPPMVSVRSRCIVPSQTTRANAAGAPSSSGLLGARDGIVCDHKRQPENDLLAYIGGDPVDAVLSKEER
jgi:hypothetical protein